MDQAGSANRIIHVTGHVQGVFFRASARDEARRLGLAGWARNEPDGSVRIEVEGDPSALDQFIAWCRIGPPRARVKHVAVEMGQVQGHTGFRTR